MGGSSSKSTTAEETPPRRPSSAVVRTRASTSATERENISASCVDFRRTAINFPITPTDGEVSGREAGPSGPERANTIIRRDKDSAILVAAIDFGTTYSGYAFSFMTDKTSISTFYWNGKVKTPTVVLFDPDKKFHSFGDAARDKYQSLMKTKDHTRYYLFEKFKMTLFAKEMTLTRDMVIEDVLGKPMKAFDVFVESIKFIVSHMMKYVNDSEKLQTLTIKSEKDIHWLLTVPAIWKDLSKRFMREAAVQAGIPDSMLSLALEPEAASLFCHNEFGKRTLHVGCKFVVLDLGGGTADITCHELKENESLVELHQPTGGDYGGTSVDNKFIDLLNRIFGANVMRKFRKAHTKDYWEIKEDFELKKRLFDGKDRVVLKFPPTLIQLYEQDVECTVMESLKTSSFKDKVEFKLGKMFIAAELMKTLFDYAVQRVREATEKLLKEVDDINFIIMVGGFSESPYVQKVMKEGFGNIIVMPAEPSGAVVKGAVIYGHKRDAISSRRCKFTYGIARMVKFKSHHPQKKRITVDGVDYCDDLFNKHIEIGTEVSMESEHDAKEHEYFPPSADARQAVLEVYASTEKDPQFIDDPSCQLVGLIKLDIDPKGDKWAKLMIKMLFGGTELKIRVRDLKNGTKTLISVDFLG